MVCDRFSNCVTQIEAAGQTIQVWARKGQYRPGMFDIGLVSELAGFCQAIRIEIDEVHSKRPELWELLGEADRVVDALNLTQAVFRPGIVFSWRHHDWREVARRAEGGRRNARRRLVNAIAV